jgi:hypothetical protein
MKVRHLALNVGVGLVALTGLVLLVWTQTYPETSDPKNIRYVLWKWGIGQMDVDLATGTMIGDGHRDRLVIGKTKEQLRERFGFLRPPSEVSPYLRSCYESSGWSGMGKEALFLRGSPWFVLFDGDRATHLVLIKGC